MHGILPRSWYTRRLAWSFGLALVSCGAAQGTSWYMKPWKDVYRKIHPDAKPNWRSLADAREWARNERELVEPVLLGILNSEYQDIPWTHGLPVAREIPTGPIKDLLHRRLQELVSDAPDGCMTPGTTAGGAVTSIVEILGHSGDDRVKPIAWALASKECQPALVVERSVEALQRVGDRETILRLRDVPLRQRYDHIERLCALTEKVIDARVSGRDILANAVDELRTVTGKYIQALEARDSQAFVDVQPFGYRRLPKVEEVTQKAFAHPDMPDILRALKEVHGREQFEVDRDKLQATLIVDGRYKFDYILEDDGWKISGPTRVGP